MPAPAPVVGLAYALDGAVMIALPLALGAALRRAARARTGSAPGWGAFLLGACVFVGSQLVHLPLNLGVAAALDAGVLPRPPAAWIPLALPLALGLSAGLCEELARLVGLGTGAGRALRTAPEIAMVGLGHGGCESAILGGVVLVQLIAMVNAGERVDPAITAAFWGASPALILVGALERALAIAFHTGATLIVGCAVIWRRWWLVAVAVGLHAALDALAVALAPRSIVAAEAVVAAVAALTLATGLALARRLGPGLSPRSLSP